MALGRKNRRRGGGVFGIWRSVKWLQHEGKVLLAAGRDPRTPWYARAAALGVVGYVISPIDLIPDFIPVVGWLDDLVVVPAGLWVVKKLIPREVWAEHERHVSKAERQ